MHRMEREWREADDLMCKSLGVTPEQGPAAMAELWQHTFTAERDRRAGPGANAQHNKGIISRQLKAELRKALADGND